jgi:hypothetical protein
MPVEEGVAHLIDELLCDLPESEVVILDHPEVLDSDGTAVSGSEPVIAPQAILSGVLEDRAGNAIVAEADFDPQRDVFLTEHQFEGSPILPAVIAIEAMAETALLHAPEATPFALQDVSILAGLRFFAQREARAQIHLQGQSAKLYADAFGKNGAMQEPLRLHFSAQVIASSAAALRQLAPTPQRPPEGADWKPMQYLSGPTAAEAMESRRVYHGPALRTLQRICGWRADGASGDASANILACGELIAPSLTELRPQRPHGRWRTPAALLDGCLVACGAIARKQLDVLSLPGGFRKLTVLALPRPGERCRLHLRLIGRDERFLLFDFVLEDESQAPLLWAEEYRAIVLPADGGGKNHD